MTTDEKIKITMSERRPMTIAKADWPLIARGKDYSGQHEFQAFDGARVHVRRHKDGRTIVYGYAGDWDGGGRPTRENREAGFLLQSDDGEEVVRAIRRVAGILAETDHVGEMAHAAARRCIADLPADDDDTEPETISMPREGAVRLLATIDRVTSSGNTGIDPMLGRELAAVADELRAVLGG